MRLEPGFVADSRIVHLTHTTLHCQPLCGDVEVCFSGEPEHALICEECDRVGREARADSHAWLRAELSRVVVELSRSTAPERPLAA